jgi:hypothetical protein
MKIFKQIITLALTIVSVATMAQSNGGFEDNSVVGCRNATSGIEHTISPFNKGKVPNWNASHGTPQIQKDGCPSGQGDVHSGSEAVYMAYSETNKEGIFQTISISKDESFNVAIFAKGLGSKLIIKFADGLVNENPAIVGGNPNIPNPSSQQLIIEKVLSNAWQEVRIDEIIADADYSQVWIYSPGGTILVDDFSFFKSCCEPYKLWQNITNPPSTYVNNYIKAGDNVDATLPVGKVIITDAEPIEFHAGQSIELLPGFETEVGATFEADIKDCGEKEFEISVSEIDPWVISGAVNSTCNKRFQVAACYGSQDCTISWDNGFGENRTSEFWDDQSENISLISPQWLFANVVDNETNITLRKGVFIPASPFSGSFDFTMINAISPGNDGINDYFVIEDETKIGELEYGYNAFSYDLVVRDRGGSTIFSKSGTNTSKGFKWNEISYLENACIHVAGGVQTFFGILDLENCSKTETVEFQLLISCPNSTSPEPLNVDDFFGSPDILVFPNPSTNKIVVESKISTIRGYKIFNNSGAIVKARRTELLKRIVVELDDLSQGSYFLEIEVSNEKVVKKIIVIN